MQVSHKQKLYSDVLTFAKFCSNIYTFATSPWIIIKGRNLAFIFYFLNKKGKVKIENKTKYISCHH